MFRRQYQALLGLNIAAVIAGFPNGLREVGRVSYAAYLATRPAPKMPDELLRKQLERIPMCDLDSLLSDEDCHIKLRIMKYEDGVMPYQDMAALLSLLVAASPSQVLEIGTYMGHTTRAMAENLETAIIHTIDLPLDFSATSSSNGSPPKDDVHLIARRIVGREFKKQAAEKRIVQHFGDTALMDFSRIGKPTFFFIDGSHTYEYCKNDSEKCFALCPHGGTFLWHDCNLTHPGVLKLILEWREMGREIVHIQGTDLAYWRD